MCASIVKLRLRLSHRGARPGHRGDIQGKLALVSTAFSEPTFPLPATCVDTLGLLESTLRDADGMDIAWLLGSAQAEVAKVWALLRRRMICGMHQLWNILEPAAEDAVAITNMMRKVHLGFRTISTGFLLFGSIGSSH